MNLLCMPELIAAKLAAAAPNGGYVRASTMDSSHTK